MRAAIDFFVRGCYYVFAVPKLCLRRQLKNVVAQQEFDITDFVPMSFQKWLTFGIIEVAVVEKARLLGSCAHEIDCGVVFEFLGHFVDDVHVNVGGHQGESCARINNAKLRLIFFWIQNGRVPVGEPSSFNAPKHARIQLVRSHPDIDKPLLTANNLGRIEASEDAVRMLVVGEVFVLKCLLVIGITKADDAVLD